MKPTFPPGAAQRAVAFSMANTANTANTTTPTVATLTATTIATACALLLAASGALAQAIAPDAGQTLREMQRPPAPSREPANVQRLLDVPAESDAGSAAADGVRLPVQRVVIEGATRIPEVELLAVFNGLIERGATLGEWRAAARRINDLYQQRGFVVARAFLPAQRLDAGVLRVQVLEGTLSGFRIDNGTRVGLPTLDATLKAQGLVGQPAEADPIDRALLLLADLPSVGRVHGRLAPGAEVGSSELLVAVHPGKPREAELSVDNYGNRFTGEWRVNGRYDENSYFGRGDRLSLRGSITDEKLLFGRAAYDEPFGGHGLRLGLAASGTHYRLAKDFAALDANGSAWTLGAFGSYPIVREVERNVWVRGGYELRRLRDEVGYTGADSRKRVDALQVELYGDRVDHWQNGGYTTWQLGLSGGRLRLETAEAVAADDAGPKTRGSYAKLNAGVTHLRDLSPATRLWLALAAQGASRNLDSSEKMVLGGAYGVRAYPQGEGAGDEGVLLNAELRHQIGDAFELTGFVDAGSVRLHHRPYDAISNTRNLSGIGGAVGWVHGSFAARATLAWRTGPEANSAPDRRPRLWVTASWRL